jgi:hypothetical protein
MLIAPRVVKLVEAGSAQSLRWSVNPQNALRPSEFSENADCATMVNGEQRLVFCRPTLRAVNPNSCAVPVTPTSNVLLLLLW